MYIYTQHRHELGEAVWRELLFLSPTPTLIPGDHGCGLDCLDNPSAATRFMPLMGADVIFRS
jgi:hypothetical protein